ncbi:uncharacterized protein THITE_2108136 [Thermothielavioides terrestris NRRL 8126]|uniref:Uncharacterized protein n=1 Tax=Thermothielavioides terrestris (strain ATCC 38088 / NRRL 8126) TaxID=578455 RepID=G2QXU4_THETT|nr:uncharacterized protein THITE_2108136 [Thermothielavioides terrestris NRRL 8126]AEO63212.1 hypothetical protein THITE_2108136 [Thermothielavioides terrestris NRRL 8126]
MTSAQDIASKLAYVSGQLNAGGKNKQMLEWFREYKKLREELKQAKAAEAKAAEAKAAEAKAAATESDTAAGETRESASSPSVAEEVPEGAAGEAPGTTAPKNKPEAPERKSRKVTFKDPPDDGSADES